MKKEESIVRLRLAIAGLNSRDCDYDSKQFYIGELEEIEEALLAELRESHPLTCDCRFCSNHVSIDESEEDEEDEE